VILATQEAEIKRTAIQSQPWRIVHKILSQKYPSQKRAGRTGDVAQVVERLLCKREALSSNTIPTNKTKWLVERLKW
jgi:hypothetical protein